MIVGKIGFAAWVSFCVD